jgi:hypothetical protein
MLSVRSVIAQAILIGIVASAQGIPGEGSQDPGGTGRITTAAVSGPDLQVSLASTKPVWPENDVKVTITVKNAGDTRAPLSDCRVIIRQSHAPKQVIRTIKKDIRALGPGEKYSFTFSLKLELGFFEVTAKVDRKNKIAETDERNNEARIEIAVQ